MIRQGATFHPARAVGAMLVLATSLQACDAALGLVGIREARISDNVWSTVAVQAGGRGFLLQTADGKPLDGQLAVVVMGWAYPAQAGQLVLPEVALRQIKERSDGWFLVVAPGYLPRRVWMGQAEDQVVLQPVTPVVRYAVPPRGGAIVTPDKDLTVVVPQNLVKTPNNKPAEIGLSTYTPAITPADDQALGAARTSFMDKLKARSGKAAYSLAQTCDDAEAPLPCAPIQHALGLLIAVNGPIQAPATIEVSYDLDALLRGWDGVAAEPWVADPAGWTGSQIARAKAAARILRTFRQIDALPGDQPGFARAMLGDRAHPHFVPPGVILAGRQLVLPVPITAEASGDSFFQTRNLTAILLGVKLEVTVVNPAVAPLPGVLAPNLVAIPFEQITNIGGQLIGNNGAGIISDLGGGVVSTGGGGVVSTGGGGIIGNNGGALVGRVDSPLATGLAPKYRLRAYTEAPQAGLLGVDAADQNDVALAVPVATDAAASYRLSGLADSKKFVFARFRSGPVTLRGVAAAPGTGTVRCDLNAATTAVTCWILDELRRGRATINQIKPAGYTADIAQFQPLLATLSQAEAEQVAGGDVATVAALVRTKYAALAYVPQSLVRVSTLAGSGVAGWVDGVGAAAELDNPVMGALDLAGRLIVSDSDGTIRRIDPVTRAVSTIAGIRNADSRVDGPQAAATFFQPWGVAVAPTGNILIADHRNGVIRRIDMVAGPASAGYVSTFAGSGAGVPQLEGTGAAARFSWVAGIARHPLSGDYYIVDNGNNAIRRMTTAGVVTTFAGSAAGLPGYLDGLGTAARFNQPAGICFDGAGNMIVADRDNHVIRHITPAGLVTTLAGSGSRGFFDGAGLVAQFDEPRGVQVDQEGGVLVVDSLNNRLRRIRPDQAVVTVAGDGAAGFADGDPLAARFNFPRGLVLAPDGTIHVIDSFNHRIRTLQ